MTHSPLASAALLALIAAPLAAQPISGSAALKARAKISADSAKAIAHREVPNGSIKSGELEEEKGKLIYSFDIKVAGKKGVEEVNIDALTGAVVAHEPESAKQEKAEKKAERAEKKDAKKDAKPEAKKTP